MRWTVIVVCGKTGRFSHSFTFIGSHDSSMALEEARDQLRDVWLGVFAIVKGDHPAFGPEYHWLKPLGADISLT